MTGALTAAIVGWRAASALTWSEQGTSVSPVVRRSRSNRVVVAFHEVVMGGATRSVMRAVPLLEERGWDFSFWVPKPSLLHDELSSRGFDVDGAPRCIEYSLRAWRWPPGPVKRLRSVPGYLRAYRAFLADRQPALVHANSILTLADALVARRTGVPTMLHAHEMLPLDARGRMLRRAAWEHLDRIVAVSEASAQRLAWRGQLPEIVFEAAPVPDKPVAVRDHPNPFTVGTVAVVSKRKGSDLFVEAAQLLSSRRNGIGNGDGGFRFEMVGPHFDPVDRDWADALVQRATNSGIDHVAWADVFDRFKRWDAFVLPSRSDPFPISMLEAMASGLPVVGTRADGIAEQVTPGAGVLVDSDDARGLADAIAWLADQPGEVRGELGQAARERVSQHFSLTRQAEALDCVYRSLVK